MLSHLRKCLQLVADNHPKHYRKRMFASFHEPSGNVSVYIDSPDSWPRIVMLDSKDVSWSKVDDSILVVLLRKLRKMKYEQEPIRGDFTISATKAV